MNSENKRKSAKDNRRRFERVPLQSDWEPALALLGAQVYWPNHESSAVFDISYQGLAAGQPALLQNQPGDLIRVDLQLGGQERVPVDFKLAWLKPGALGGEFVGLSLEAREAIDTFLEDRLVGRNLRRVDERLFAPQCTFTDWYHGPRDTNVYLWRDKVSGDLQRAEVELGGRLLIWEAGELRSGGLLGSLGADLEDGEIELPVVLDRGAPVVRRAIEMLSQMEGLQGPLRVLLTALAEAR